MTNYQNFPFVEVENVKYKCSKGWEDICSRLKNELNKNSGKRILVVETYQGVIHEELINVSELFLNGEGILGSADL